jgi:hypothetical protein
LHQRIDVGHFDRGVPILADLPTDDVRSGPQIGAARACKVRMVR